MSDIVEDEENLSEKHVENLYNFENKYMKDQSSTPKVNTDMVKKVNTDKEMITIKKCRYKCLKLIMNIPFHLLNNVQTLGITERRGGVLYFSCPPHTTWFRCLVPKQIGTKRKV